jgi:stage 0 sporulation protein B (sporulation initiation phosphotransferase)
MQKEWDVISILRHYRHDLLNHIQLINGYLAMGKVEKVQSLIDELVRQSKNESHLSNLNMNQLAKEVLTFNWEAHSFHLKFEVLSKADDWSYWEEMIVSFFREMMSLFDEYTKFGEDQNVFLMINDIEEKVLEIDFQGSLCVDKEWDRKITRLEETYGQQIDEIEWNESECYVRFCVERVNQRKYAEGGYTQS